MILFFYSLLAALALAQTPEKPAETPRALYERAAYVEEHERDFQKAADLYASAAEGAKKGGDEKLAVDADAARARALARGGRAPVAQTPIDENDPILRRIADLLDSVSKLSSNTNELTFAKRDLALFGAPAVPWVERAVSYSFSLAGFDIAPRTTEFVDVLARMQAPEALAALERLAASPDPITRRAVAGRIDPKRQHALLERVLKDESASVRDAAMDMVASTSDLAFVPAALESATRCNERALEWLARTAPADLVGLLNHQALAGNWWCRGKILEQLYRQTVVPADPRIADGLLAIAKSSQEPEFARSVVNTLTKLSDGSWKLAPPEFRLALETQVAAQLETQPVPEAWDLLLSLGGMRSLDVLAASIAKQLDAMNDNQYQTLVNKLAMRFQNAGPQDFQVLVQAFSRIRPYLNTTQQNPSRDQKLAEMFVQTIGRAADAGVPDQAIAAALSSVSQEHKQALLRMLGSWVTGRYQAGSDEPGRVLDPALGALILEMSRSEEPGLRTCGIRGLTMLDDPGVLPQILVAQLRGSGQSNQDRQVQQVNDAIWTGTRRLVAKYPERAATALEKALEQSHTANGAFDLDLIVGVSAFDSARSLALFQKLWPRAQDAATRQALLGELLEIEGPQATALVLERYPEIASQNGDLRRDAVARFGAELYEPALPVLGQALADPDERVRKQARDAFARFKAQREALEEFKAWQNTDKESRDSIAELTKLLESQNRDVVIGAVRSLAAVKAKSALPALVKLLARDDAELKREVQSAIEAIGK